MQVTLELSWSLEGIQDRTAVVRYSLPPVTRLGTSYRTVASSSAYLAVWLRPSTWPLAPSSLSCGWGRPCAWQVRWAGLPSTTVRLLPGRPWGTLLLSGLIGIQP